MRISDWSSDVCTSDLTFAGRQVGGDRKAHAIEDILVALGGENLVDAREVPSGRRLVAPQLLHLRQSRRNMRGIALRPAIGIDRKSDVEGKSVSARVDLGGRHIFQ